jgi:hypothetical protein
VKRPDISDCLSSVPLTEADLLSMSFRYPLSVLEIPRLSVPGTPSRQSIGTGVYMGVDQPPSTNKFHRNSRKFPVESLAHDRFVTMVY